MSNFSPEENSSGYLLGYSAQPIQFTFSVQLSFSLKILLKFSSISSCFAGRSLTTYITSSTSLDVSRAPASSGVVSEETDSEDFFSSLDEGDAAEPPPLLSPHPAKTLITMASVIKNAASLTDRFIHRHLHTIFVRFYPPPPFPAPAELLLLPGLSMGIRKLLLALSYYEAAASGNSSKLRF